VIITRPDLEEARMEIEILKNSNVLSAQTKERIEFAVENFQEYLVKIITRALKISQRA
jgi:hypothetical protein